MSSIYLDRYMKPLIESDNKSKFKVDDVVHYNGKPHRIIHVHGDTGKDFETGKATDTKGKYNIVPTGRHDEWPKTVHGDHLTKVVKEEEKPKSAIDRALEAIKKLPSSKEYAKKAREARESDKGFQKWKSEKGPKKPGIENDARLKNMEDGKR